MKGRKKRCSLPLTFILLFVCITGHATTDLHDSDEEDILGKRWQKMTHKSISNNKTHYVKMHCRCNSVLENLSGKLLKCTDF